MSFGRSRILVVEPVADLRESLADILSTLGYEVTGTGRLGETLRGLSRGPLPHLILLALDLPDGSGLAVLERRRGDARLSAIPVIVVSRLEQEGQAIALGADEFLLKPIRMGKLLARIDQILGGCLDRSNQARSQNPE